MNGLELSRAYYETCGKPVLERDFADLLPYLAVGLIGSGSEGYGFDDDISRDHDFEPGFCLFLPGEDVVDRRRAFQLERAYAKLPNEFEGVPRQRVSPVGGNRHGVLRTADFYTAAVGDPNGDLSVDAWLHIPDYALAEAVNGEVFFDGYGQFTRIRERLRQMPEDVRLKRLAGQLLLMAQAGQYNFTRCLRHGEPEAAALAAAEYVTAAMKAFCLLRGRYLPYYKWSFRAVRGMDGGEALADRLSRIVTGDPADPAAAERMYDEIESVASQTVTLLQEHDLTRAICGDLEKHAYSVNDGIRDGAVRNLHILTTV